ncbi:MAG TPA: hypothetical protein VNW30_12060 [Opitutaceae bacterium]|nr:hypothetical protein [Opitutaceae bacterium]
MKIITCPVFASNNPGSLPEKRPFQALRRLTGALSAASVALALAAFGAGRAQAQTVVPFSTPGNQTWTCPTGVASVQVESYGGGGGSGGVGAHFASTGGGAGGSYVKVASVTVTPGTVYQLTVGAGGTAGAGGAVSGTNGGTGGSSYFGNSVAGNPSGAVILAVGGPGSVGNNTAGVSTTNRTVTAGATATNSGNIPSSGAAANFAGTNGATPVTSANNSGAGGAGAGPSGSSGGGAGGGALTSAGNGNPGSAPGGGGGGADQSSSSSNGAGAAGGAGRVVLTFATATPTINSNGTPGAVSAGQGTPSPATSFSVSGNNLSANITVTPPAGFEVSASANSGYAGGLSLTPSGGTVTATTIYVRLAASDSVGNYSGNIVLSSSGATTVNVAIPTCNVVTAFTAGNLAVEQLVLNATSSTFSIIELNASTANQTAPVNAYLIPSTAGNTTPLRQSSAGSTGRLALSNDGTLLAFTGFEDPNGVTDETSITQRGAASLSNGYAYTLQASYNSTTGTGDQTRGATYNGGTWYMSDKNGIWLNGAATAANATNVRPLKSFGGTVYAMSANANVVSTVSADGTTLTTLPGLATDANAVDFYMISSGVNGSAFDILYVLDGATVTKYSLVGSTWTENGSGTAIGVTGDGFCAIGTATGANLYTSTGTGNAVVWVTDTAGYNQAPNINTANNVTLYTAASGYLKGLAPAPLAAPLPDLTIGVSAPATVSTGTSFNYTVTLANSGAASASGVTAQFTLPSGLAFVSATDNGSAGFSSVYNSGVVSFSGGTLAAGVSETLTVAVTGSSGTTYVVDAGSTPATGHGAAVINTLATTATPMAESNAANNYSDVSVSTQIISGPDVTISVTGSSTAVANSTGSPITYTILAQNIGGSTATAVNVQFTLPAGLTFISAIDTGSAGFTGVNSSGVVTFSGGTLPANSSETLTVTAEASTSNYRIFSVNLPAGAAVITASNVTGSQSSSGAVTTNVTLPAGPDLVVTSTPNGPFLAGDATDTFTLYVTNNGTSATSGTVTLTDTLPTGFTPAASMNGSTINGWSVVVSGQTVTATRSDVLNPGAQYPATPAGLNYYPALTLTFGVASGATGSLANAATVTGGSDAFAANDSVANIVSVSAPAPISSAGYLLISRAHYAGANITAGSTVLPNGATATASGAYPQVWGNDAADASFGVTAPIYLDVVNQGTGALVNSTNLSTLVATELGLNISTSFSSKSEVSLNLTPDGTAVTFSAYLAPAGTLDVSNANNLYHEDPTCLIAANGDFQRAIVQVDYLGDVTVTPNDSYCGDNCRAALLANAPDGSAYYFTAGSSGNSGAGVTGTTMTMLARSTGIQMVLPGAGGLTTAVGEAFGTANSSTGYQLGYAGQPSDKTGKDMNLRGLAFNPYNDTLYTSKGSGGNGVDTVYQIGSGSVPTAANANTQVFSILNGFPTASGTDYPFGMFFANASTLYVTDEGQPGVPGPADFSGGVYTQAIPANNPSAGLQKWVNSQPDGSGTWTLAYTLTSGLNLGVPYSYTIANYPTGTNSATGVPWQPANNGLRNMAGQIKGDGTVTIYAATSTISGETDQGADPNEVVAITDNVSATSLPSGESFTVLENASGLDAYRGVAISTPYTPNLAVTFSSATVAPVTSDGYTANGVTLDPIGLGFAPILGQVLTLVNNTGAGAIVGTFTGLPQGSTVTANYGGTTYYFTLGYTGGDGNDITLTNQAAPVPTIIQLKGTTGFRGPVSSPHQR